MQATRKTGTVAPRKKGTATRRTGTATRRIGTVQKFAYKK